MKKIISILLVGVILGFCAVGFNNWALERHKEVIAKQYKEMTKTLQEDVVHLMICESKNACVSGTGFVIKSDDTGSWIVSNKHVCQPAFFGGKVLQATGGVNSFGPILITNSKGSKSGGQIIKLAQNADLCLIRSDLKFKKPLKLASDTPKKNSALLSYGFPEGKPSWAQGKLIDSDAYGLTFVTISDMKVFYGASGSPVVNENGEVIGVVAMITFKPVKGKPQKKDVLNTLIIPLELLREFIGGL